MLGIKNIIDIFNFSHKILLCFNKDSLIIKKGGDMVKPIIALLLFFIIFISGCTSSTYPFDQVTTEITFTYNLPKTGVVEVIVLNCYMKNVRTLLSETTQTSGDHSLLWNLQDEKGNRVPDGLYYIRIILDDNIFDTKIYEVYK